MERLTFVLLNLLICSVNCMDMPLDPVNGEMIMTPTYHVNLTNGQQLRFVNKETLNAFLKNPLVGLGDVLMVVNQTSSHPITALCPVCGMNTHAPNGPQVHMQHGDQHIYTCSLHHAHQVHDSFASYSTQESTAAFCTGTGTTMQNGFQWFSNPSSPCILLWFSTWSLNTQYKYLGGCLLIILCAMFNEYLLYLRRVLRKETNYRKGSYRRLEESHGLLGFNSQRSSHHFLLLYFRPLSSETQHVIHSLLHGSTILFAYLLMLVSMTYDGILFGCCILGYILGYYLFGERREKIIEE